ncbi:MAG: PD40 domain-containing protein [Bdellovibrionales bacterium]|nr:PD40 domain-containing protein [Bdellovibrionales bacterium]
MALAISTLANAASQSVNLPGPASLSGIDPLWDYQTLETENFRVTYDRPLKEVAEKSAKYLEEAHTLLSPVFQWKPRTKTQVLVIDNQDSSNGYAVASYRLGIVLYVTPPDSWSSLYYYDDWLKVLAYHEYVHLLNIDTTTGWVYKWARTLSGDWLTVNGIWPFWMIEGLAVYYETRLGQGGRGRSPYWNSVLRASVEEKTLDTQSFITLDRLHPQNPYFPGAETHYLFGYHLMNQMAQTAGTGQAGDQILGKMSFESGARVPFFLNGHAENLVGKSWYQLWDDFVAKTRNQMGRELEVLKKEKTTEVRRITEAGFEALGSAASPDGKWVVYSQDSLDRRPGLYLYDVEKKKITWLDDKFSGVGMAFTPDSKTVVMSALRRRSPFYLYSDLVAYDLPSRTWRWITTHGRARDPDVSRDGKWVAYVKADTGRNRLEIARLENDGDQVRLGEATVLFDPAVLDRVANPKFSPDGQSIYFTFHENGKFQEDLWKIHIPTQKKEKIRAKNGVFHRFPAFDGQGRLHVVSDENGVDNLYRAQPIERRFASESLGGDSNWIAVTHLDRSMILPTFSRDTLYASVLSSGGWDLAELKTEEKKSLPSVALPIEEPFQAPKTEEPKTSKPYSIWPSILPRVWLPQFSQLGRSYQFGLDIQGFDAVEYHRYDLNLRYDLDSKSPVYQLVYTNRMLPTPIRVSYNDLISGFSYFKSSGALANLTRNKVATFSLGYNFQGTFSNFRVNAYGTLEQIQEFDSQSRGFKTGTVSLQYDNQEFTRLGVGAERGISTSIDATWLGFTNPNLRLSANFTSAHRLDTHTTISPFATWAWDKTAEDSDFLTAQMMLSSAVQRRIAPNSKSFFPIPQATSLSGFGYPSISTGLMGSLGTTFRFPVFRIFRGVGTLPYFMRNIFGSTSLATAYLPRRSQDQRLLPTATFRLTYNSIFFSYLPFDIELGVVLGLNRKQGGESLGFLNLVLGSI